jgi:hypothetical protein
MDYEFTDRYGQSWMIEKPEGAPGVLRAPINPQQPLTSADALGSEILRLAEENRQLKEGARLTLAGFESGVFIRDINGDGSPGWMLRLVEPLRGLALLAEHGRE